jgi:hypothetical protein
MPDISDRWSIPFPTVNDPANMDDQIKTMAESIDDHAKDLTQGTFANRPAAGTYGRYYYDTTHLVLWRDNGTVWKPSSATELTTGTLPSNPDEGQTVDVLVDSTLGIVWRFRYRPSSSESSPYKWESVGNVPSLSHVIETSLNTTSTFYQTYNPEIILPFRGIYDVEFGAHMYTNVAPGGVAAMSVWEGTSVPIPADSPALDELAAYCDVYPYANQASAHGSRLLRRGFGSTPPITVRNVYRTFGGLNTTFHSRWMKITPVVVSA